MEKRALLIAYHYPPVKGSSGVQRTLRFSAYLRDYGWDCSVLTVHPRAYERTGDDEMGEVPKDIDVVRAQAFDTKRHLSLAGRYPQFMALPDRWVSWQIDGVRQGLKMLKRKPCQVIWSTYPIATAHCIGMKLAARTGLPWIADCRDSMSEEGYPRDKAVFDSVRGVELQMVREAATVSFTAPGARAMYAERYPDVPDDRWRVIENGFDEQAFADLHDDYQAPTSNTPLVLVHAGILYPNERDPRPFFNALAKLKASGAVAKNPLRVVLRATGHDALYAQMIDDLDIADLVELAPAIPYREALQEMLRSDGLLLFQAANCNHQIPAKVYEYIRASRPILALTDRAGDTWQVLNRLGYTDIADLLDQDQIENALGRFLAALRQGTSAPAVDTQQFSRRAQCGSLAQLFDDLTSR